MSGLPSVTMTEARGKTAVPNASVDKLAIVIGPTSIGADGLSQFFLNSNAAIADRGYSDAVDIATQIIEQNQTPVAICTTPDTNVGTFGTVDVTGVTGTADIDVAASPTPLGTYEARIDFPVGGTLGAEGIKLRWSLDNARKKQSKVIALGTAFSYTIPNSGVKFTFDPPAAQITALVALANDLKTDYNAHRVLTAGSVHGAADNTNAVTSSDASNLATAITLLNEIRTDYEAHRVLTAGSVHGGADSTNALTAVAATDAQSAITLALDLKAKYNAHRVLTAGSVHGAADSTNVTDATSPTRGTIVANDFAVVRTFAPTEDGDDITAAFEAIRTSNANIGLIVMASPMDSTLLASVKSGLSALAAAGRRPTVLCATRMPDFENDETESAWMADVQSDLDDSFEDSRICPLAAYAYETDLVTGRQYLRPGLAQFAADVIRVDRPVWPGSPSDVGAAGISNILLTDSSGALIGHDEGPGGNATGMSDDDVGNRFVSFFRDAQSGSATAVYTTAPWVLYADDEEIKTLMVRRVANAIERAVLAVSFAQLGGTAFYTPADAENNLPAMLKEETRRAIRASLFLVINRDFRNDIQNYGDDDPETGVVQVASEVTITGGTLVTIAYTIAPLVLGNILKLNGKLNIKNTE